MVTKSNAKALYAAFLMMIPFVNANARHLTPEEALLRAESKTGSMNMPGNAKFELSHSESVNDKDLLYVFNKGQQGFIVVSADDRMPALLGYSDNGNFNPENASPELLWWLSQYAEEASASFESSTAVNLSGNVPTRATSDRKSITPLVKSQWGQDSPYNLDCPEYKGKKCVTGCIATAMSQIIRYHGYPASGNDSHSYAWNNTPLSFDYASATFDYQNLPYDYSGSETAAEKEAVAKLMYACGVAVDMDYSPNESGASDTYIAYALKHYFNYDCGIKYLKRDFFDSQEWEDLVYSEIEAGRPIIYGGRSSGGGHQFICDGYDKDGYFHINWGWQGLGDGYFLLNSLNPEVQGTGGHAGGYNYDQAIVCGIQPAVYGSTPWYPIYANGGITASVEDKKYIAVICDSGRAVFNYSQQPVSVVFKVKLVSENGKVYYTQSDYPYSFEGIKGLEFTGPSIFGYFQVPSDVPVGDYKCSLVFTTPEGNYQDVLFPYTSVSYFNLNVDEKRNVTCTDGDPNAKAEIRVVKFQPSSSVVLDQPVTIKISVQNIGDITFAGKVQFKFFKHGSPNATLTLSLGGFNVKAGETENTAFDYTFSSEYFTNGVYDVICYDPYNDQISDVFSMTIGDAGVEGILDEFELADVYSFGGVLIKKNVGKNYISSLPKGTYIIRSGGKTCKVIK